ncbi:MAG: hypothetical protein KKH94_06840 [Candidatus Omnitrophica bacterium]|nr:hypothetical protein [Candidatus Omnitrophota bacterium]
MNTVASKATIRASRHRLKEISERLQVGDYIVVTVKRSLGEGRYIIGFNGLDCIALFNGMLQKGEEIYAVVQSFKPHIVFKLISRNSNITKRVTELEKIIASHQENMQLQPFVGTMIRTISRLVKKGKSPSNTMYDAEKLCRVLDTLIGTINDQVWYLEQSIIHKKSFDHEVKESFIPLCTLEQYGPILYDCLRALDSLSMMQTPTFLMQLKQECEDFMVYKELERGIKERNMMQGRWYTQIPFYYEDYYGTFELLLQKDGMENHRGELGVHHRENTYFKIAIMVHQKKITLHESDEEKKSMLGEKILTLVIARLKECGWELIVGNDKGRHIYDKQTPRSKPLVVNVKLLQSFTIVA